MASERKGIRIGILAHEFLINIGANDFLKNIIRGLALRPENEIVFLCPRSNEQIEHMTSQAMKERLKKIPLAKETLRAAARRIGPVTDRLIRQKAGAYAFYAEACPWMEFVCCEADPQSLENLLWEREINVLLPSIHVLPARVPYVTYWPDCQPKHYPEFFDDAAQQVRDNRIRSLLASGKPMIINSRDAKSDMMRFYDAPPEQIFDLPFAPILEFSKQIPRPELSNAYGLKRPYFIVCNQFWVHKSIETVIEAAAIAKRRGLAADIVFTGKMEEPRKPGYIEGLRKMVIDLRVGDMIHFLGYIPKDDQLELMKHAVAVIQPTLFEGGPGGGAVYDATSLGIRSIVSDIPINHELPLDPQVLVMFEKKNAEDLVAKMQIFLDTPYTGPSPEDLYQLSRASARKLSQRLYEAIDYTMGLQAEEA